MEKREKYEIEEKETPKKKKPFDVKAYMNEKVPVTLMKDNERYKDDLAVTHNGVSIKIPRGKTVMVARKYAMIIDDSIKQNYAAQEFISNMRDK